jgi:type IV pilus assembly protein PilC
MSVKVIQGSRKDASAFGQRGAIHVIYKYRARTATGEISVGNREASSQEAAVAWVRDQGWAPIMVESAGAVVALSDKKTRTALLNIELVAPKVTLKDKNVIFKQMATMINSGITVAATLDLLASQVDNSTLKKTLYAMKEAVGGGVTMAAAMARHPKVFNNLELSLIRAGEEGGVLDVSMTRLADFVEKQYTLQKKIKSALMYPSVIVVVTLLVLVVLAVFIVPLFRRAFDNIGMSELPAMTSAVFGISDVMKAYWWTLPFPFIAIKLIWSRAYKTKGGRRFLDQRKMRAPVVGDIIFKSIMSRSFRTLSTLVSAGVTILDSIEMSAGVADNVIVGEAFSLMRERAQNGIMLSVAIRETRLFPAMVGHMVAVGEETGQIDEVLSKVADWYDMELDEKIKGLTSVIEPVLIVFVGLVVGLVVGSIFIPLIQSMQQFM